MTIAGEPRLALLEVSRTQLDGMTSSGVHQGLAARVPPYEYAHPADLLDDRRRRAAAGR